MLSNTKISDVGCGGVLFNINPLIVISMSSSVSENTCCMVSMRFDSSLG